eukprot:TRINITY_DN94432_c0_g1_i1.p1 TRINITY_DN94432_c0_g1~~TRINITY_DN94432_c0_g1_i1.p1  ORF type:complete len:361 (-),score=9.49 TRINITY_DN94432_c0_g1_i1:59-1117(-)
MHSVSNDSKLQKAWRWFGGKNEPSAVDTSVRKFQGDLHFQLAISPQTEVREWVAFVSIPPACSFQQNATVELLSPPPTSTNVMECKVLPAGSNRQVLRIRLTNKNKSQHDLWMTFRFCSEYCSASQFETAVDDSRVVAALEANNDEYCWKEAFFAEFLQRMNLQQAENEPAAAFAQRVFNILSKYFRYKWTPSLDRSLRALCGPLIAPAKPPETDCGGMSIAYCNVLRSQGIPCRILTCRYCADSSEQSSQCHVVNEFWDGERWRVVDVSGGQKGVAFGSMLGAKTGLICLHEGVNLPLETPWFGVKTAHVLQNPVAYYTGSNGTVVASSTRWYAALKPEDNATLLFKENPA